MKRIKLWHILTSLLFLLGIGWLIFADQHKETEKAIRSQVRNTVIESFPKQAEKYAKTVGLFHFPTGLKLSGPQEVDAPVIVLVHGLDDPGKVWQNLAPTLDDHGYEVWQMYYPNDQPVVESAALFHRELIQLRKSGIEEISIVAHSMGGLVSREFLTSPTSDYAGELTKQTVPRIDQLIMVGTPNHGSQVARLRVFSEVRDQFVRLTNGEVNGLGIILDGAGEAKIDLLPGSAFLTNLNSRQAPQGVNMSVIAGISSPWQEQKITDSLDQLRKRFPADYDSDIDLLGKYLVSMTHGLGDGLVTVASTKIPEVKHFTVNGTHLSMIRNLTASSQRIPPAIPIILNLLKNGSTT